MRRSYLLTAALLASGCMLPIAAQPTAAAPKTRWFRDAKFGLFIHWGLYSIPAGEWKGQPFPGLGEWIMHDARIPVKEYEQLAAQFNPTQFDAEAWAKLAEDAGMKYIVITAKHHDGFAMFHSTVSTFNIFDATPFHRDPLQELAAACAKHKLKLGFYYSQDLDWHEPNGGGNDWDFGPDSQKDFDAYLHAKAEPQVKELLTRYGKVALIWFDMPRTMTPERAQRFVNLVHSRQSATLINGRLGGPGDYVSTGDNEIPRGIRAGAWETPVTMNDTWGYKKFDNHFKTEDDLIFKLVDTVSKGGNLLLNVGPTAEGIIPRPNQAILATIGDWLKDNGEAIYGAGPSPFGQEFGSETQPAKDWRCTVKPGKIFITLFKWPDTAFELDGVKGRVVKAYSLADEEGAPLKFVQTGGHVTITLPKDPPIEGELPERISPALYQASLRTHLHRVLVLETRN